MCGVAQACYRPNSVGSSIGVTQSSSWLSPSLVSPASMGQAGNSLLVPPAKKSALHCDPRALHTPQPVSFCYRAAVTARAVHPSSVGMQQPTKRGLGNSQNHLVLSCIVRVCGSGCCDIGSKKRVPLGRC